MRQENEKVLHPLLRDTQAAAILEFAVALPILVVFVVGIYDFSGAFDQKQKIAQAAQEGAIVAGAQPMSDFALKQHQPDFSAGRDDRRLQLTTRQRSHTRGNVYPPGYSNWAGGAYLDLYNFWL